MSLLSVCSAWVSGDITVEFADFAFYPHLPVLFLYRIVLASFPVFSFTRERVLAHGFFLKTYSFRDNIKKLEI